MRHLKRTAKLGRTGEHRNAMLANMVCSLIKSKRITTTLAKAKVLRPVVEKLVTLGCRANRAVEAAATADEKQKAALIAEGVHCRRLVAARVRQQARSLFKGTTKTKGKVARDKWRENEDVVHILFDKIAPQFKGRTGGYTRILQLGGTKGKWAGQRQGDAAQMAIIEFVENETAAPVEAPKAEAAK
jgi:large subunit ribosomal protein L17